MPSHIFVRLGLWQNTVDSNVKSIEVAARDPGACHGRGAQLHAMHFLQFAYLQLGRLNDAKKLADEALSLPTNETCDSGAYVAASYALQVHDWATARTLGVDVKTDDLPGAEVTWTAIGIAAARTGDLQTARRAEQELASVRDLAMKKIAASPNSPFEAGRLEVEAWIAQAEGDAARARALMTRADDVGGYASWAQPTPAELLGDLLMAQHQPSAALAAYRKALGNTPNLFNALYGAATAAEAAREHEAARGYYQKLLQIAGSGDRPELEAARRAVSAGR
jgi:tetratricopeptide (TPR) repeat protein